MTNRARTYVTLSITALGVVGFVGLLVAAVHAGGFASQLRALALIWFLSFGALKLFAQWRTSRLRAPQPDRPRRASDAW